MKIKDSVKEILKRAACEVDSLKLPTVDRKEYLEVDKVLKALGGKWNRKAGAHIFTGSAQEAIDKALFGVVVDKKKELQAFYTPENLAKRIIDLAEIQSGNTVLEPSAGAGNIVKFLPLDVWLTTIEIDESVSLELPRCLDKPPLGWAHRICDFLTWEYPNKFDRIVMNPPFTKNQWLKHLKKALDLLEEGGILVSVLPDVRGQKKFEDFQRDLDHCVEWFEVEEGAFKESGTNVKTILIKIEK